MTTSMVTARQRIQECLRTFDFEKLFVDVLGWDYLREAPLVISLENQSFRLRPLVEKRGVKVYVCNPDAQGRIPLDATLRKIEREVTKHAYEHFIIYVDRARENQVWQWVKREQGRPLAARFNRYRKGQAGERLAQKLEALAIAIDEEDQLHTAEVAGRVARAFDVERVTRRFYDRFKSEHASFLNFIQGISAQADREWYASLMLNRLMFIYFIQRKGFLDTKTQGELDGDINYLSKRLRWVQQQRGDDQFHTFYRYFLLKLFHDGLSKREHTPELEGLLGKVPYLNGGLFDLHVLERDNPEITIPDEAFEKLFKFFDEFDWHLDDRPLRNDREINPDVLGYIFEKYINQKQMGAYYTKEDITEYISKNTIIPFIFEAAEEKDLIAFRPEGSTWSLLRDNPERYVYEAVRKGCELSLPPQIEAGVQDVAQRGEWNKPAPEEYALPTETWREAVARRTRYFEVRAKLAAGEITSINDLITYNLDIRQFAQDAITYGEGSDLLRAFYDSIASVTVLDPTCGSGAFLFAALNILEALYEACLERMQSMVDERDLLDAALPAAQRRRHPAIEGFREILHEADRHPNRTYFIYKSIIINNLYGVDIMEEATEICKLRLFLKLVSQVAKFDDIEPLPDIDFNIRAGNTLVGFASQEETKRAIQGKTVGKGEKREETAFQNQMIFDDRLEKIEQKAQGIERDFENFRKLQIQIKQDAEDMAVNKQRIRENLQRLGAELDGYLASEYGIDRNNIKKEEEYQEKFKRWQQSHQPFHWWVEFYGIMKRGGFEVIIGNPPYVEYKDVKRTYTVQEFKTLSCGDLYAYVVESAYRLIAMNCRIGMIVPISIFGTDAFGPLQELSLNRLSSIWISCFANRPTQLFDGAQKRLTILLGKRETAKKSTLYTTSYLRWTKEEWNRLFKVRIQYTKRLSSFKVFPASLEKFGSDLEVSVFSRLLSTNDQLGTGVADSKNHCLYYTRKFGYFLAFLDFVPRIIDLKTGGLRTPSELKELYLYSTMAVQIVIATLSSTTFFWFWNTLSDCRNLNRRDLLAFPLNPENLSKEMKIRLSKLGEKYLNVLRATSRMMLKGGLQIESFYYASCKPIIDEIDCVLAKHYGFTDEELDFIINYDIKYRMGRDSDDESEE